MRLAVACLLLVALAPAAASAAPFTVTYKGTGEYETRFRAHPPNPGGADDHNAADDWSRQRWAIAFRQALEVPACGAPDPCTELAGLSGARGVTAMTGRVNHRHDDGLYRQLDRTVRCRLRLSTSARANVPAQVRIRYVGESDSFAIRAPTPLAGITENFPGACPKQGDSIDRILDFYAMPGFSFADSYGPERWFDSGEVLVPAERFRTGDKVVVRLRDVAAGRPPRGCAVPNPSYERCRTRGSWRGKLTFTRRQQGRAVAVAACSADAGTSPA